MENRISKERCIELKKSYLILAHHLPSQLKRLILALEDGESQFFIHLDKKADISEFSKILTDESVIFIEERHSCAWGDFSIVEATLSLLEAFISTPNGSEYGILLSGQDYPLVSNMNINSFLTNRNGINFIDASPVEEIWGLGEISRRIEWYRITLGYEKKDDAVFLPHIDSNDVHTDQLIGGLMMLLFDQRFDIGSKKQALKLISKPRVLPKIPLYGGKQWFALTSDVISKLLSFVKANQEYFRYHIFTHVPDEIFFSSIMRHLQQLDLTIKIEGSLTYVKWDNEEAMTFNISEQSALKEASKTHLFARKFHPDVSRETLTIIDKNRTSI